MIRLARLRLLILGSAVTAALCFVAADVRPGLGLVVAAAAVLSHVLTLMKPVRALPSLGLNALVLASAGYALLQAAQQRTELITVVAEFLTLVLLIRLQDRCRLRDEAQTIALSLFVVIGAILTSNSLALGLLLMIYTPLIVTAIVYFQAHAGHAQALRASGALGRDAPEPATFGVAGAAIWSLRRTAFVAIVLSLLLGVIAFVVTPRNLIPSVSSTWGDIGATSPSGFSDTIRLGASGVISQSPQSVMEVVLRDGDGRNISGELSTLYLRGAVLTDYDRDTGSWERRDRSEDRNDTDDRPASAGTVVVFRPEPEGTTRVRQEVTVRRVRDGTAPLFSMFEPATIMGDEPGRFIRSRSDGIVYRQGAAGPFRYVVSSVVNSTMSNPPPVPPAIDPGPRIRELVDGLLDRAGVSRNAPERDAPANRRAINEFRAFLREGFSYTLEMTSPMEDEDPIEMFLFRTKAGHCEYFASALAIMCRTAGIDARVVTGYAAGEFNPVVGHFVVRESDAHAWVEARVVPTRWETIDPTPEGSVPHVARRRTGLLATLRQFYDALEFTWVTSVVSFDQSRVGTASRSESGRGPVLEMLSSVGQTLRGLVPETGLGRWAALVLVAGAGVFGAVVISRGLGGVMPTLMRAIRGVLSRMTGRPTTGTDPATRFYGEALAVLARAGHEKGEGVAPMHFARSISHGDARVRELVIEIVERYYRVRFGGVAMDSAGRAWAVSAVAELRRRLQGARDRVA